MNDPQASRRKTQAPQAKLAFTLIELVVVISVILVLAALTLSVSVAVVQGSEVRQTEATLKLFEAAVREWELQADRTISYGNGPGFELDESVLTATESTEALLMIISKNDAARKILAQIDPDAFKSEEMDNHPFAVGTTVEVPRIYDAWGNQIVSVFPGPTWSSGPGPNPDGTAQTGVETICGVAKERRICFASPGPDGQFGDMSAPQDTRDFELTTDNVYSYALLLPIAP